MKKGRLPMCALAGVWLAGASVPVLGLTENPYTPVVDRNVFGLKPPVVVAPPSPEENRTPAPKIILTGITTILGNKRALMKTPATPKPGEPARENSYILTEGQREDDIEVLAIDEKAGTVKVNNHGTVLTLNFEKDGPKLPSTPAPTLPTAPGVPPGLPVPPQNTIGAISPTGVTTPGSITPYNSAGQRTIPTRSLRLPPPGSVGNSGIPPTPGTPGYAVPGVTVSGVGTSAGQPGHVTLPGFTQVTPGVTQSYVPPNVGSATEQAILIEAMRQTDPGMGGFLPPTPLNPRANLGQVPQPTENPAGNNTQQQPGFPGQVPPGFPGFPPGPGAYR